MRPMRAVRLVLGISLICAAFAVHGETPAPKAPDAPRLRIEGVLGEAEAARIARGVDRIVASGATTLLIELRGASGSPVAVLGLAERIRGLDAVRTVAFVDGGNLGAGTVVALACDELRMTRTGLIGAVDCGESSGDRSRVIASLRRGRDADTRVLLESMVLPDMEVPDPGADASAPPLVREGALLTLDAPTATRLKLAGPTVASADVLARELGLATEDAPEPASGEPADGEPEDPANGEWTPPQFKKAAIIFIDGPIMEALEARVRRRIEKIKEDGSYDLLVIQTDSPGGTIYHSELVGDLIFETGAKMHTVAWIPRDAISGACLTSYAAKDIVMGPAGTIGDCQPIIQSADGYKALGEKIQSPLRATFRKYAQRNGYAIAVAESMVTQEIEVLRVTDDEGRRHYFKRSDWEKLDTVQQAAYSEPEIVVGADKLPTFTAQEAKYNDLARAVAADRDAMLALYGIAPSAATEFPITWSEEVSQFLLAWKGILFFVGLIALYLEFKAPGFGVAGFVGIVAFTLFFTAGAIGGVADSLEIVLFLAGVGLIVVELFVLPGFGVPGIAGLVLIIVSLYMASTPFAVPNTDLAQDYLFSWMLHFGGAFVAAIVAAIILARFLPSVPLFNRIMLAPPSDAAALAASGTGLENTLKTLVGASGVALTDLRPAGRAEIEGKRWDVVTRGSFIEAGSAVVVVEVKANRIVVRPRPKPGESA